MNKALYLQHQPTSETATSTLKLVLDLSIPKTEKPKLGIIACVICMMAVLCNWRPEFTETRWTGSGMSGWGLTAVGWHGRHPPHLYEAFAADFPVDTFTTVDYENNTSTSSGHRDTVGGSQEDNILGPPPVPPINIAIINSYNCDL